MSKISIIIPVYFNEGALIPLYEDMKTNALSKIIENGDDYEIIMIDDGSQDNSWNEMLQLYELDNKIQLIHLSRNFGEHSAILCGYANCTGDCAVNKAADLQESSSLILEMFNSWKKGNNIVLATREKREEGFIQQFFANFYYWCARKIAFPQMPRGGFNISLLDRKAIDVLLNMDETNVALEGQILSLGFRTSTVPYIRKARKIGKSRWTLRKKIKCFSDMMFSNSNIPILWVGIIGGTACVASLIMIIYYIAKWFLIGEEVVGWTSTIILLLLAFGITMLTMSILGNYIWRCFESIKRKPVYIIEEKITHEDSINYNENQTKA